MLREGGEDRPQLVSVRHEPVQQGEQQLAGLADLGQAETSSGGGPAAGQPGAEAHQALTNRLIWLSTRLVNIVKRDPAAGGIFHLMHLKTDVSCLL